MKKLIAFGSVAFLLAFSANVFALPKLPKKPVKKVVSAGKKAVKGNKKAAPVKKTSSTSTKSVRTAASQSGKTTGAVSKSTRTKGAKSTLPDQVERTVTQRTQAASRKTTAVQTAAKTQEAQLITETLASLDKKADEYICTFGFADSKMQPIYKEEGAFVNIGDAASVAEVEARIQQARQTRPQARFLVLQARKPLAALPRQEDAALFEGFPVFEESLPNPTRNLREYVYDLEDNSLVGIYQELPGMPEKHVRFILDGLE